MKYLIIECTPLYNCLDEFDELEKVPICIVDDYSNYKKWGYEVYRILSDNSFEFIQHWEEHECGEKFPGKDWR